MRHRLRRVAPFVGPVIAALALACSGASEPAPVVTPEPVATAPVAPDQPPAAPIAPVEEVAPAPPPPPPTELPEVTRGPAIRLPALEISRRRVGNAWVPAIAHPNEAVRAQLDTICEETTAHRRCVVTLATDKLVALRCLRVTTDARGGSETYPNTQHYAIEGDVVRPMEAHEAFHPGTRMEDVLLEWQDDPEGTTFGDLAFTRAGLELGEGAWEDDPTYTAFAWRRIAPYVRADGPLGPALIAAGIVLAPIGTHAPNPPPRVFAIGSTGQSIGELLQMWSYLPAERRSALRLLLPAHGQQALAFPADTTQETAESLASTRGTHQVWWHEPTAEPVILRVTQSLRARERPSARGAPAGVLPGGTIVVGARGSVEGHASDVGEGNWAYVAAGMTEGWASGRYLVAADACGAPERPSRYDGSEQLAGLTELRSAGARSNAAWFTAWNGRTTVTLFAMDGCTVGAQLRQLVVEGALHDLFFVTTERDGGDTMVVVVSRASETALRVSVFGPSGTTALYAQAIEAADVTAPTTRGPAGASGYWPVEIASESDHLWLAWNGTGVDEQR